MFSALVVAKLSVVFGDLGFESAIWIVFGAVGTTVGALGTIAEDLELVVDVLCPVSTSNQALSKLMK